MQKIKPRAILAGIVQFALLVQPSAAGVVRVTIDNMTFAPSVVEARIGDTVEWVNADFLDHTATSKSGEWDIPIAAGKSAQLRLTKAGSFDYYCRVHPNMTGTIRVLDK
jgi:plastocyanin